MHILVASDGHLDAAKATDMIARLHEPGDTVTLLTALDHPREFLRSFADITGAEEVARIAHEAGAGVLGIASGAKAAERLTPSVKPTERHHQLNDYFTTTAQKRLQNLSERLEARGIEAISRWNATENQTARTILDVVAKEEADIVIIGSHGRGRFEGQLGSTVTKIVRRSPVPVIVLR